MAKSMSPPAISSYAFVHEPREGMDGGMEYSMRLIFDKKTQMAALKKLKAVAREIGTAKHGKQKFKLPFRDGDKELEEGDQDDEALYTGRVFFNTRSTRKPGIVGRDNQPLDDPEEELYSGCIVKCSLNPFAWKNDKGGRGVSFGLVNIKKLADGPRLDGATSAEEDFEGDDEEEEIPFETVAAEDSDDLLDGDEDEDEFDL